MASIVENEKVVEPHTVLDVQATPQLRTVSQPATTTEVQATQRLRTDQKGGMTDRRASPLPAVVLDPGLGKLLWLVDDDRHLMTGQRRNSIADIRPTGLERSLATTHECGGFMRTPRAPKIRSSLTLGTEVWMCSSFSCVICPPI